MTSDPEPRHHRHTIRVRAWDYRWAAAYHVTLCTGDRHRIFGKIRDARMVHSSVGEIADRCWQAIPDHFPTVILDEYIVMPNHLHGILIIASDPKVAGQSDSGATLRQYAKPERESLGSIIGNFKAAVTRQANALDLNWGGSLWQRNYYESIIRNDRHLKAVREYIAANPANWEQDEYHVDEVGA